MTRKQVLAALRYAGYHGDKAKFTRLIAENRISFSAASAEYAAGARAKKSGVPCGCGECSA